MPTSRLLTPLALMAIAATVAAAPQADGRKPATPPTPKKVEGPKPTSEPPGAPVELTVRSKADAYDLDAGGDPPFKFQEKIRAGEKDGLLPRASRLDLELEFKNVSSSPVQIQVGGDGAEFDLTLKGNGAITVPTHARRSAGSVTPKTVTIKPGKTYSMPLTELAYGFRNQEKRAYITEPGVYELTVAFRTGVSPAPKGARPRVNGFGEVLLKAPPVTLRVVRPS